MRESLKFAPSLKLHTSELNSCGIYRDQSPPIIREQPACFGAIAIKCFRIKRFGTCNLFIHVAYFPFLKERYGFASMFILDVAYSQRVVSIFISENNIWIALLVSRHKGPFIRRYKMKRSYILNMYFMSEISTILRSGVAIGKYKCLVTKPDNYCHLFLRQKSTKCSSKCEPGFTCNCRACPGWYQQCIGYLKQAGLILVLFNFFEASRVGTWTVLLLLQFSQIL